MNYEQIIKEAALDLSIGETSHKTLCPWCGGGKSKERAFNITRKDPLTVVYVCHRVSCANAGALYSRTTGMYRTHPKFEARHYKKSLLSFTERQLGELCDRYHLQPLDIPGEWKYGPDDKALVMPAHNFADVCTGLMLKRWPGTTQLPQKNMYYKYFTGPNFAYYPRDETTCVVVEDQVSAVKVRVVARASTLALLGTHMNDQLAGMLSTHHKRVIVALDPDTWTVQDPVFFRLARKHGGLFDSFVGLKLPKDPKDLPRKQLKELLNEYI